MGAAIHWHNPEILWNKSGSNRHQHLEVCVRDWKAIATAHELNLKGQDLDRAVQALAKLQEQFRPLVADLTPDIEPATTFDAAETEA